MFQPRIQDFLDAMQLCSPGRFDVFKALIHFLVKIFDPPVGFAESGIHVCAQISEACIQVTEAAIIQQHAD